MFIVKIDVYKVIGSPCNAPKLVRREAPVIEVMWAIGLKAPNRIGKLRAAAICHYLHSRAVFGMVVAHPHNMGGSELRRHGMLWGTGIRLPAESSCDGNPCAKPLAAGI